MSRILPNCILGLGLSSIWTFLISMALLPTFHLILILGSRLLFPSLPLSTEKIVSWVSNETSTRALIIMLRIYWSISDSYTLAGIDYGYHCKKDGTAYFIVYRENPELYPITISHLKRKPRA